MTFGAPGKEGARVHALKDVEAILDAFLRHGHREIDSARTYCGGTSEEYLGKIDWKEKGLIIETKLAVSSARSYSSPVYADLHAAPPRYNPLARGPPETSHDISQGLECRVRGSILLSVVENPNSSIQIYRHVVSACSGSFGAI